MTTINVETVEKWNRLETRLQTNGYELWQWQYNVEDPYGFHAWFGKVDGQLLRSSHIIERYVKQ